jgi:hypothetical protein
VSTTKNREKPDRAADLPSEEAYALARWHESRAKQDASDSRKTSYQLSALFGGLAFAIIAFLGGTYVLLRPLTRLDSSLIATLSICSTVLALSFGVAFLARLTYRNKERQYREQHAISYTIRERKEALDKVVDNLNLGNLFSLNRAESDEYHLITRAQAAQSFRNAQIAMFFGFSLIGVGVVAAVLPTPPEVKIAVSVISLIGGTVGGYINRTFLEAHSLSIAQLNNFFRQPLVQSYLLTAERIALQLENESERAALLRQVVEYAIRAADAAGASGDNNGVAMKKRGRKPGVSVATGGPGVQA